MKYHAFISYSHADESWGSWLHRSLETFRTPKGLVGGPTNRGETVPARVFPIFRDREELPTSADLGKTIQTALNESRYLIVICSPAAARSRWVNEEIKSFRRLGRSNRILALIVDGEPNAADGKPGIDPKLECFPQALKHPLGADGELNLAEFAEPIAADVRPGKDGKQDGLLKLLAGLLGVNFDDLKRRDEIRRRKRQRVILATVTALLVLFAALAGLATWQWQESERRGEQVRRGMAAADIDHALSLDPNQAAKAIQLEARALRMDPDTPYGKLILWNDLGAHRWQQIGTGPLESDSADLASIVPLDEGVAGLTEAGQVLVKRGTGIPTNLPDSGESTALASASGLLFVGDRSGQVAAWDQEVLGKKWSSRAAESRIRALAVMPGNEMLLAASESASVTLIRPEDGSILRTLRLPEAVERIIPHPHLPLAALQLPRHGCFVIRTDTEAEPTPIWPEPGSPLIGEFHPAVRSLAFMPEGRLFLAGGDRLLHLYQLDVPERGAIGATRLGEIALEIPPAVIRPGAGHLVVGCLDGSLQQVRSDDLSAAPLAAAPGRAESLLDLSVVGEGGIIRLFASGRVDTVTPGDPLPRVEPRPLGYVPSELLEVAGQVLALGASRAPKAVEFPPGFVEGALFQETTPLGEGRGPSAAAKREAELFVVHGTTLRRQNLRTGEAVSIFDAGAPIAALAASPDGAKVVVVTAVDAMVLRPDGEVLWRGPHGFADAEMMPEWSFGWAPNSEWVAIWMPAVQQGRLAVVDPGAGELRPLELPNGIGQLLIAPGSDRLLTANAAGEVAEWSASDLALIVQRSIRVEGPEAIRQPRRSAAIWGERKVFIGTFGGEVIELDLETGGQRVASENGPIAYLEVSDDRRQLMVLNDLGVVRVLDLENDLALLNEFRTSPASAGPALLWAGSGPFGTLATIDRLDGLELWDWRGRRLAARGPFNSPQERNPASLRMVVAAGGEEDRVWLQFLEGGQLVTRILVLTPRLTAGRMVELAGKLTGQRLAADGALLPVEGVAPSPGAP